MESGNQSERVRCGFIRRFRICSVHSRNRAVIYTGQACVFVALVDMCNIAAHFGFQLIITEAKDFAVVFSVVKGICAIRQLLAAPDLQVSHQLAEICLSILGIDIKHLFAIYVRVLPFSVLKEQECSFKQRHYVGVAGADYDRFFYRRFLFVRFCNLFNTSNQILHKAELGHILRLQVRKFFRQIIRIHIFIGRDEHFLCTVFDEGKVSAPLVLNPNGIEILRFSAKNNHHLCAVESSENIRFISRAELIFKSDTSKEDFKALLGKLMIQIIC